MDFGLCYTKEPEWFARLNRLALGTVQFGLPYGIFNQVGQVSRPQAKDMLRLAAVNCIDTLDTAIGYGESEACLGEVGVQGFNLVTKLPVMPKSCYDVKGWVQDQVAASLARLGVSDIYGLLLHRSDELLGPNGKKLYLALQELKNIGKVKKVGISIYAPSELESVSRLFRLDLVQAPFNLVDRRLLTSGWLKHLNEDGIEVHTRSAFLQGLLLMPQTAIPAKFTEWTHLWKKWHHWLSVQDVSALQACLAFPQSFPEINRVVVGADSLSQFEQIIVAANSAAQNNLPDLQCDEDHLINPTNWFLS
jgi:aryl-alcohol dehydrogenase-like predicted oxidoreductase